VLADRISDLSQEFEAASHIKARNSTGLRHHTLLTGTSGNRRLAGSDGGNAAGRWRKPPACGGRTSQAEGLRYLAPPFPPSLPANRLFPEVPSMWNYGTFWFRTSLRGIPCRPLGTNLQLPGRCENALLIWDSPIRRATLRRPRRIGR
jgi:hypothetical protein